MLSKRIKYTDYNGETREETFYFNLSKGELIEMENSTDGGMQARIQKIIDGKKAPELMALFKSIIMDSYGEKSADGKRFVKSKELSIAFTQTEAYSELLMELISSADSASKFIKGVIPADLARQVDENAPKLPASVKNS